jgi:hypothetical protein
MPLVQLAKRPYSVAPKLRKTFHAVCEKSEGEGRGEQTQSFPDRRVAQHKEKQHRGNV